MRRLLLVIAFVLVASALPARAATVYTVHHIPTVGGAWIRVEVLRDPALDPQPVILTYSPYHAGGEEPTASSVRRRRDHLSDRYVPRGYARAWADVLGTRGSSGCWDYGGAVEQQSGVDLVNGLAAMSWSNGKVAMIGVSYDGTTATMVGVRGEDAPGLAAIVPIAAISRWYEYSYYQGARLRSVGTPPLFDAYYGRTIPPPASPGSRATDLIRWRAQECGAVEHTVRAHEDSPRYDDFWLQRDYLKDAAAIRVPTLIAHGWQDYNVKQHQGINLWDAIPEDDPATAAREGAPFKILYMFQGGHSWPTGERWVGLLDRFFAQTLKGVDHGLENEPESYTQVAREEGLSSTFEHEASFPPPQTKAVELYLTPEGTLDTAEAGRAPTRFTDLATSGYANGFLRQRATYRSAPLARSIRLAGSALLDAVVSVDRPRAQLGVHLRDDGLQIAPGYMNLRYRNGLTAPEDLPLNEPVRASVVVKPQDVVLEAGSVITVVVGGSHPDVLPDVAGATFTIHQGDAAGASKLVLPIVDPPADAADLFE